MSELADTLSSRLLIFFSPWLRVTAVFVYDSSSLRRIITSDWRCIQGSSRARRSDSVVPLASGKSVNAVSGSVMPCSTCR